jgi:6-phosphogluconolactonase
MMLKLREYANFSALSDDLINRWLAIINNAPENQPCSFALAGGTTPEPLYRQFDALFSASPNRAIQLVATDERWVPDTDGQSNEGLFRRCFMQSASNCKLVSLKNNQPDPATAVADIDQRLKENLPCPFSSVVLGMGTDGHIASLFPDQPQLLVDDKSTNCVAAFHPQTKQARISLSLSRLLNTNAIWLVITGEEKRAVLENAAATLPIGALLAQAHCDVDVFWCPN